MRTRFHFAAVALAVVACTSTPSDLREWRASDHDTAEQPAQGQAAPAPPGSGGGIGNAAKMLGVDQVVLVTWRQSCAKCHGTLGRGDGPEGAMYGARNLADPAFQKATSDEQLAAAIKDGKGRMPAFQLPDSTITGLVHLIRMMNAEGPPGSDHGSATPPPSGSAPPAAPPTKPAPRMKRGATPGSPR